MYEATDSSFCAQLLEALPDAVIWVKPVCDKAGVIEDFEIRFSNQKANEIITHATGSLSGLRIKRDKIPSGKMAEANFKHFLKVFETGQTEEFSYNIEPTKLPVETLRRKLNDGVLSTTRDRAAQREAEKQEQNSNGLLQSIVQNSPNGIVVYEAIRNENGSIDNFRLKHYNERSNQLTGHTVLEREQKGLKEILTDHSAADYFDRYVAVVEEGKTLQREQYIERTAKWIMISLAKLEDGFIAMLTDITELKKLQSALQHQSSVTDGILDASLSGIYSLKAVRDEQNQIIDFKYEFVNAVTAQMLGISAKEVVGKSMLALLPENKTNGFFDLFCNVLQTGQPMHDETHFKTEQFNNWFEYAIVKMENDTLVVTLQDITEKKLAALQIEQQKSMLDNILKYSSSGISVSEVIRNEAGKVIDARTLLANDATVKFTGIPKKLYLLRTALELDPALRNSLYYTKAINTLETGEPFNTQYYLKTTGRWLEISVSKMDNEHIITIFTDVTETRTAQLHLEKLVEDLKKSNSNLEEFTYAASHDLKEPIRKIHTFINQLRKMLDTRLNQQETQIFERIRNSTDRMTELVDDLLEYSHVTVSPQEFETIDLNAKVTKVLDDLDLMIQEKQGTVRVGSLPVIKGHRRQMQQLFENLIGNAFKYSKPGVPPEISITSKEVTGSDIELSLPPEVSQKTYHKINVKDNGIGFEQQYKDKIFQVFQRLHGKSEYKGTGVGLAIVKKVVQNHHGFITASSEPGIGSTFTVFLPQ